VFTSEDLGIAKQPHFPAAYLDQLVEPFRPYRAQVCADKVAAR